MQTYALPRETFNSLVETFGDKKKCGGMGLDCGVRHRYHQ